TTLVSLIPRFYDVDKGEIELDGHNINDFSMKNLRDQVSFVPQKATLFTGTIRDNMKYGNPNATDDQIWHAL
ncbi:ATP-binding cassette domain-containing protein, partial [Staphylococcus haemolyticus]